MLHYAFRPALLLSAFLAVVQVIVTMGPGAYYAWRGVITLETRRALSTLSWFLLLPALSFYNIGQQISASTIVALWPFAANALLANVTGLGLGLAGAAVTRSPRHLWRHIAAAAGFGNSNSLPLLIMAAVCQQQDMPFFQALGSQCSSVGFGYVALASAATQIVLFPVAAWLLGKRPTPEGVDAGGVPLPDDGKDGSVSSASAYCKPDGPDGFWMASIEEGQSGAPTQPADGAQTPGKQAPAAYSDAPAQQICVVPAPCAGQGRLLGLLAPFLVFVRRYYLTPASIVPAVALLVACVAPLKDLLFPQVSAPLGFLTGALDTIQQSLLFVTSFILGAVLCKGPGPGQKELGWRPCVLLVTIRMLIMPIFGAVMVIGSHAFGLWTPLNPAFTFVLLLQWAVPTASQMQNLASMAGNHELAIGSLIFWQYAAALLAMPAWMSAYLFLMDRFSLV